MPPRSRLAHLRRARSDGEQQNNSSPWSVTMEMCSTSLERGSRLVLKLSPSLHPDSHMCPALPAPHIKTQRLFVCFILMGDLTWVVCTPLPRLARAPTCSYGDDTLYWNMLTLLPWQRSQRITVLQHITPPTTSAASEMCCSPPLCVARCFGRQSAFLITRRGDQTSCERVRLFFPPTRAVNRWREATLMNRPIVGCT